MLTTFGVHTGYFLDTVGLVLASLAVPILWGWLINWIFNRWRKPQDKSTPKDSSTFLDYQI